MKIGILLLVSLIPILGFTADNLESKLNALNIPSDEVSPVVSEDQLYIVNTRYSSLINRHELTLFGANNFTADSHLTSREYGFAYRYHINDKWSLGLRKTEYNNELSDAGEKLFQDKSILPDTDYAKDSWDISTAYNLFYGKFRLTKERVVYCDQYIGLGYGKINLASGKENLMIADIGIAFWIGKHMSSRLGVRNEFYKQQRLSGEDNVYSAMGYLEFGYLFGEGSKI